MKKEAYKQWMQSAWIGLLVFLSFSLYLYLRRGYYNLYIANKVFGSTSAILAGITLVLGPLARMSDRFDRYVVLRKPLGLTALGLGLLHTIVSLFFLPSKFTLAGYIKSPLTAILGLIAVFIWLYLAKISDAKTIQAMGSQVWRTRQNLLGRLAFIAIFLHLVIMKYPGWTRWFQGQVKASPELANPHYPPASLFVFIIMLAILIYRKFFLK